MGPGPFEMRRGRLFELRRARLSAEKRQTPHPSQTQPEGRDTRKGAATRLLRADSGRDTGAKTEGFLTGSAGSLRNRSGQAE